VVVATAAFADLAREAARDLGIPEARIATVVHPIGGVDEEVLRDRADGAIEEIVSLLSRASAS
jgi:hypothetical protein